MSVDGVNASSADFGRLPGPVETIAQARAAEDRDTLARLLREGKVRRDYSQNRTMRTQGETVEQFRRDVDGRASGIRPVKNLAMKPKKRKR